MESIKDKMPRTPDWNKERLAKLKELMPDIFTNEGQLNINELKKVIDPELVNETERFDFRWFGKSKAKREAFSPTDATLVIDPDRSVNPENTENIIIEGENLAVLKLLSNAYREKIKCIYIDPPYNTGRDFVYSDRWNQEKAEYWENAEYVENGIKVDTNAETDGRFHSNWLNMMYSRLLIARQLLKEDGVIFISINDSEIHHTRKLCDEVFGQENFVSIIVWHSKYTTSNDAKFLSTQHEYLVMYAKRKDLFNIGLLDRTKKMNAAYTNPDSDERGPWKPTPLHAKSGTDKNIFTIQFPNGIKWTTPKGLYAITSEKNLIKLFNDNRLYFNSKGGVDKKTYLSEVKQGKTVGSLWSYKDIGSTHQANEELANIIGKGIFDNPKPSKLIETILKIANGENEIILDFFGGSGSTGHGVLKYNLKELSKKKFILIQLPETTEKDSEPFKAGYKKISDITIERNKRVIEKIIEEKKAKQPNLFTGDKEDNELQGLGFKVFKLQKSNFPRTEFAPDPDKTEAENIELFKKYIKDKEAQMVTAFNKEELITEILIKKGYELNYTITQKEEFKLNDIYHVTDGNKETLICLDGSLNKETVEYFKQNPNENLIVLERALDTTKKWNLKHYMGDNFVAF